MMLKDKASERLTALDIVKAMDKLKNAPYFPGFYDVCVVRAYMKMLADEAEKEDENK